MKTVEVEKLLAEYNKFREYTVSLDEFNSSATRYLKASRQKRLMCVVDSVSRSGISRNIKIIEQVKGNVLNFTTLLDVLGFTCVNYYYFRVSNVFDAHYRVIYKLYKLGYITKKTCDSLTQHTPHTL